MAELTTAERETLEMCREPQLLSAIPAIWQPAFAHLRSLGMIDVTRIDRSCWYETTFFGYAALAGQTPERAVQCLTEAAPALFLACKKALAVLGNEKSEVPMTGEAAEHFAGRFEVVLHLVSAIQQAEGREAEQ